MNPLDPIVVSFVNKSFEIGEWLLREAVIDQEDLDDCDGTILIGIPCLAILHCIEKSSNFDDGFVHLAVDKCVDSNDPRFVGGIKVILDKIIQGTKFYRLVEFNYESYDNFKKNVILNNKQSVNFTDNERELYKILYDVALGITQINEYKQKFINVINCLNEISQANN